MYLYKLGGLNELQKCVLKLHPTVTCEHVFSPLFTALVAALIH